VDAAARVDRDPRRFPVSPDDSSRSVTARVDATSEPSDPVEAALAKALEGATAAGRFDVVALLAGELQRDGSRAAAPWPWMQSDGSGAPS
jgi:hypothetical protein